MAGRIAWIGLAGLALGAGMVLQDGDRFLSLVADTKLFDIDRGVARMEVVGQDGQELDVSPEMQRAIAQARRDAAQLLDSQPPR